MRDSGSGRSSALSTRRARRSFKPHRVATAPQAHSNQRSATLLNIVDPTSAIRRETAPVTLVGNRGTIHNDNDNDNRIIHHAVGKDWLYCVSPLR